jgi:membrane-bound ClpP family serine protease
MLEKTFTALGIGGVILLIVGVFVLGPWLSILAVNQLFGTTIQLTFWNWLSAFWLHIIVASTTSKS